MGTHETKAAAKEREAQRDRVNGDARAKHQPHVAERRSKGTAAQGQRLRRRTAEQSRLEKTREEVERSWANVEKAVYKAAGKRQQG
jgi:hypothetical protein